MCHSSCRLPFGIVSIITHLLMPPSWLKGSTMKVCLCTVLEPFFLNVILLNRPISPWFQLEVMRLYSCSLHATTVQVNLPEPTACCRMLVAPPLNAVSSWLNVALPSISKCVEFNFLCRTVASECFPSCFSVDYQKQRQPWLDISCRRTNNLMILRKSLARVHVSPCSS